MFDSRKLNLHIDRGCEAVRFATGSDKKSNDSFIVDEMAGLTSLLGDETWTAESLRRWRGSTMRRTPISVAILNKFVYVCLAKAGDLLKRHWADDIFAANDLGPADMHPQLLKLLDDLDFKQAQLPPRQPARQTVSPLQRPSRVSHFVGRDREFEAVMNGLQRGGIVTIWGPGGVGKSALAAEVVWRLAKNDSPAPKFPDGVVYYNFYDQPEVELAFEHIALSFQVKPRPTPRSAAQRALSGRKILLVLDGAEVANNLTDILEIAANCGVIITTRHKLDSAGTIVELGTLSRNDAVTLFQKSVKTERDEEIIGEICRLVDGLPLAVKLAGRYVAATKETMTNYLNWLTQSPLAVLHHGERQHQSISVLLHKSLQQVSDRARQVFAVIGMLAPTSFAAEPVATALEQSLAEVRAALNELLLFGLLQRDGNRYQVGHLLIYTYARQNVHSSGEIIRQLVGYFITSGLDENHRGVARFDRLAPERRHWMQLLAECQTRQAWPMVQRLVKTIDDYLDLQGYWTDRITAFEAAKTAAQQLNDGPTEASIASLLGDVYLKRGQAGLARQYLQEAVDLAAKTGNRILEASCLFDLSRWYYEFDDPNYAATYFQQVLVQAREICNERLISHCMGHIGLAYQKCGEPKLAIFYLSQALDSTREFDDLTGQNRYLGGMGLAYLDANQPEKAVDFHSQALAIARQLGDRRAESIDLGNLAITLVENGDIEAAIKHLDSALTIAREMGDEVNQARWLVQLGKIHQSVGDNEQANEFFSEALPLLERFSQLEADQLRNQLNSLR